MFGDFSRFTNDPELGLTGVYLSQGSPLLDSDWNEQVAALSDWITLVGRMSAGDSLRQIGFDVTRINAMDPTKGFRLSSGVAMLAGRAFQMSQSIDVTWDKAKTTFSDPRVMAIGAELTNECLPYFVAVETAERSPSTAMALSYLPSALRSRTDWRVCFTPDVANFPAQAVTQGVVTNHFKDVVARSFGETGHLTPQLTVTWSIRDELLQRSLVGSSLALIECHNAAAGAFLFKVASSPDNRLAVDFKDLQQKPLVIHYRGGQCAVLDNLTKGGKTKVFVELETTQSAFELAVSLFREERKNPQELHEATIDPNAKTLTILSESIKFPQEGEGTLRVWSLRSSSTDLNFPLINGDPPLLDRDKKVRAKLLDDAVLLPGDRWYLPLEDGHPMEVSGRGEVRLPGQRVFRAIAKLDTQVKLSRHDLAALETSHGTPSVANTEANRPMPENQALQPVSLDEAPRRFDASIDRLTSALNATRMLTRNTPCKELQTRVSCLPLRRWLAAAYVHEIADLDLDTFLAKVQRSIDIPFEEEHRFRDQAALVLEEARRIGGSLESDTSLRWA